MTPTQAAKIIGCTPGQVRTLIRTGVLRARKRRMSKPSKGFYYDITPQEARCYRDEPQPQGWPRGQART